MDNTITITPSGIAIGSPLVAGTQLSVTATGMEVAEDAALFLIVTSRFPDLLVASCPLSETTTEGEYAGTLYTATKQMSLFLVNARADEARSASIELVDTAHGASLARTTVPIYNSSLIPQPCRWPSASPLYVPGPAASVLVGTTTTLPPGSPATVENVGTTSDAVLNFGIPKGPAGPQVNPSDDNPLADGAASPGMSDAYARGDHRHPTDTTRQEVIADLSAIRSGAAAGATAVQPSALATVATTGDYDDLTNKPTIPPAQIQSDWNQTNAEAVDFIKNKPTIPGPAPSPSTATPQRDGVGAAGVATTYARGDHRHPTDTSRMEASATGVDIIVQPSGQWGGASIATFANIITERVNEKQDTITDLSAIRSGAAAGATAVQPSALATVATTGDYDDLTNKPTIPAAQVNADWNAASGVAQILNKPTIPDVSGKADSTSIAPAFSTSSTYAVGDYVTHEGLLYKCTTAVSTAGAWNAANWSAVAVTDAIRYSFASPTPSVSGTSATVACEDRAINDFTVATGITSLTITPPAAVTGRARDFFCRVTLTDSSLPTVTLSGGTIDIGATEVAGMTQGVNLLMFTEIASSHWLASRRSAS